jgi:hypothetical protein
MSPTEVVSDLHSFQTAIAHAQLNGLEYIEVDQKVFDYFIKKSPSAYFFYGSPGIRVYLENTKDQIKAEEAKRLD